MVRVLKYNNTGRIQHHGREYNTMGRVLNTNHYTHHGESSKIQHLGGEFYNTTPSKIQHHEFYKIRVLKYNTMVEIKYTPWGELK